MLEVYSIVWVSPMAVMSKVGDAQSGASVILLFNLRFRISGVTQASGVQAFRIQLSFMRMYSNWDSRMTVTGIPGLELG